MNLSFDLRLDLAQMNVVHILSLLYIDLVEIQYLLKGKVLLEVLSIIFWIVLEFLHNLHIVDGFSDIIYDTIPSKSHVCYFC